mmetsp:Transcript_38993/g.59322  ORF Transcript_38993/g.59322 Transcript_38993/m.59322 type:complete len:128 (+) Transcript_38993:964-1347(+)
MGCSLGASNLTNVLGDEDPSKRLPFVKAAMCLDGPLKLNTCVENLPNELFGFYDFGLGLNMMAQVRRHSTQMPEVMSKMKGLYDIDVDELLKKQGGIPSILKYDREVTCKMFGYKDPHDYYVKGSCS